MGLLCGAQTRQMLISDIFRHTLLFAKCDNVTDNAVYDWNNKFHLLLLRGHAWEEGQVEMCTRWLSGKTRWSDLLLLILDITREKNFFEIFFPFINSLESKEMEIIPKVAILTHAMIISEKSFFWWNVTEK